MKAVAVADPRPARHRRIGGRQPIDQHGTGRQNQNRQNGAKTAAKGSPAHEV
jgi:hypothetical protein